MTELQVRARDRSISCEVFGAAHGFPIVLAHGMPDDSDVLAEYREYAHCRFIRYRRPGYHGSTRWQGRAVADTAADAAAVCDELGLDRFGVLGWRHGGPHALAIGALLPERVTRVAVLDCPDPPPDDGSTHRPLGMRSQAPLIHVLAACYPDSAAIESGWADDFAALSSPWGFDVDSLVPEVRHWRSWDHASYFVPPDYSGTDGHGSHRRHEFLVTVEDMIGWLTFDEG